MIVGTRGRSLNGLQGLRSGSVSKYCLQNSPVPVVVVRPEDKRKKKKNKRLADSKRQGYNSVLAQSNASANGRIDAQQPGSEASETEATAVARAIGLNEDAFGDWKGFDKGGSEHGGEYIGTPLTGVNTSASMKEDMAYLTESPSPTGRLLAVDGDNGEDVSGMELGSPVLSDDEANEDKGKGKGKAKEVEKKEEDVKAVGEAEAKTEKKGEETSEVKEPQGLGLADDEASESGSGKGTEKEV